MHGQGEVDLLLELLAAVEWQQFTGVQGIQPQRSLQGLVNQRALRLRSKAQQYTVRVSMLQCLDLNESLHVYN